MRRKFSEDLEQRLRDAEFAKDFGAAMAKADFALILADARYRRGVTQAHLASRLGTTQAYIAKLERGDANPTIGTIGEIMAVLGLRLSTSAVPLKPQVYSISEPEEAVLADGKDTDYDL